MRGSHESYLSLYDLAAKENVTLEFWLSDLPCKVNPMPLIEILQSGTICREKRLVRKARKQMDIQIIHPQERQLSCTHIASLTCVVLRAQMNNLG